MDAVKQMIVANSGLPCSIVIIGVGSEQFEMMHELDSDDHKLKDCFGNEVKRDYV